MMKKKPKPNGGAGRFAATLPDVTVPAPVEPDGIEPEPVPDESIRGPRRKLTTAEIMRATGLSAQRIHQRKRRGETGAEIVAAVEARKRSEQAALRDEAAHRSRTSGTAPAPLSYSVRFKAESDAALRALELQVKRGELVPIAAANNFLARSSYERVSA